jgi:hypothetical protein
VNGNLIKYLTKPVGIIRNRTTVMTTINFTTAKSAQKGWDQSFSPRVARVGIALIVAAVAVLGLLSASFGSNSDSSRPSVTPTVSAR